MLAQMSCPDMRTPIAYSLAWPERMHAPTKRLDLAELGTLTFEAPDEKRFPALRLAREVLAAGGSAGTVLNAANEVAVEAFLAGRIGFLAIAGLVEATLAANAGLTTCSPPKASTTCSPSTPRRGRRPARCWRGLHKPVGRAKKGSISRITPHLWIR